LSTTASRTAPVAPPNTARAADQVGHLGAGEAESQRVERELVDGAGLDPPDGAGGRGRQLVETVVTMHHQHTGPARREHTGHHLGQVTERAADQPGPRATRIGERPKQIEHSRHTDLPARRTRELVGRVEHRRKTETDTQLSDAARHVVGSQIDAHSQRFEHVGTATLRRGRPVAVLDHRNPRGRHHDRGHGGEVHGVGAITAGADDVDGVGSDDVGRNPQRVTQHGVGQFPDLRGRGALHLHRHAEGGDLSRRRGPRHDLVHRPGRLTGRQLRAGRQPAQDLRP